MLAISDTARGQLANEADAAVRQLYTCHARALRRYVEQFCPDRASAEDIVQETFIRAWRHLPQLSSEGFPVRPWLYRVARNLLIDADRAARSRPATVQAEPDDKGCDDTGLSQVLDRQLVTDALRQLSPAHRAVLDIQRNRRRGERKLVGLPVSDLQKQRAARPRARRHEERRDHLARTQGRLDVLLCDIDLQKLTTPEYLRLQETALSSEISVVLLVKDEDRTFGAEPGLPGCA